MQKRCEKSSSFEFFLPDEKKGGEGGVTAVSSPGVAVSSPNVSTETPVAPFRGAKWGAEIRKRIRKPRPANIRDARRHIERTWKLKTGGEWVWTPLYRANLRSLIGQYRAAEIMALWDLYISTERTVYKLYYMERSLNHLWEMPQFKPLVRRYDEILNALGGRY